MADATVRLVARHFVAGLVLTDERVTRAAPIVMYMLGWPLARVQEYSRRKGWAVTLIDRHTKEHTMTTKGWLVGLGAALLIGFAGPSDAVEFTWNQAGGFALGTGSVVAGPEGPGPFPGPGVAGHGGLEFFGLQAAPPAPANTYSTISWGCPSDGNASAGIAGCANGGVVGEGVVGADPSGVAGRSSLISTRYDNLTSPAPLAPIGPLSFSADGTLRDDGLWVVIGRLDHLNRIIDTEGNYLGGISIQTNLSIAATPPFNDGTNSVPITFIETLNTVAPGDCTAPNPLGSACDDVFTFDASDYDDTVFTSNGTQYLLQFTLSPVPECSAILSTVGTLTVYQCSDSPDHRVAIDFDNGLAYAQEGFDNAFMTLMRITEIPNVATLALLGLGLAGVIGWRARRDA